MTNKKICLITPMSSFLLDERTFYFIGILKIAAYWESLGYKIDHLDLGGIENPEVVLSDYLSSHKEDDFHFIGMTATSPQLPAAYKLAKFIKELGNYKLVLGGTHATLSHTAYKREMRNNIVNGRAKRAVDKILEYYDILCAGDGEFMLEEILNKDSGVIDGDDRNSKYFLSRKNLEELPYPARHLIDIDSYKYFIDGERATNVIVQLGCSMKCKFCGGRNSHSLRIIRTRSWRFAIDEIEHLYLTYGFKAFNFFDDELNINKEMIPFMNGLSDLQEKYGVDFKLRGFTKSELFNDEQAKAMYRAGFRILLTGFESGNEKILSNIRKNATRDDNTRCVEIAKKHNLKVKALLSIGHVGESHQSIEDTKNWVIDVNADDFDLTIISPYPGSPYYDDAEYYSPGVYLFKDERSGDLLYQEEIDYSQEAQYYKGAPGEYKSYVWTDHISAEDLVKERDNLEKEIRAKLNIPYNPSNPAKKYEHSMGSSRNLPDWIVRSTEGNKAPTKQKRKLNVL